MTTTREIDLDDQSFAKLKSIIHKETGITIGDGRKSMLLSRLRSRLRETQEPGFKSYISRLSTDSCELQELINRVTTNKTYFYRTPRIWDHFQNVALQEFLSSQPKRPMRVWSAASSSGEEAHTIGILLEEVRKQKPGFDYKVFGSDISSRVLQTAEAGIYTPNTVSQFKKARPDLVQSYFEADAKGHLSVRSEVKSRISFRIHNLQKKVSKMGPFDVVFLRNVLIYFSPEDQENILSNIRDVMPPNGTLYIGESESVTRLDTDFEIVEPMIYQPRAGMGKSAT